jgi:hypothetical protein
MSQDQTAFITRRSVPKRQALQKVIDSLGFHCKLHESFVPFKSSGFLPCSFNGGESGFEISFGPSSEHLARLPKLAAQIGTRDVAIRFCWRGDLEELACVLIVCIALAMAFDAVVYQGGERVLSRTQLADQYSEVMKHLSKPGGSSGKKNFIPEVLRQAPELRQCEGFFYEPPVAHILCGFVCDRTPIGGRIYKYAVPLYDHLDELSLMFADELRGPFFPLDSGREAATEFLRRIKPYRGDAADLRYPENLLEYIEQRKAAFRNPWFRRGYALTLIMLGREGEAAVHLKLLLAEGIPPHYPHFEEDVQVLLRALSSGPEAAKEQLLEWENATKRRFGLDQGR